MSSSISLTSAVTAGDEQAVSASLANGADVNERASGGRTALTLAVIYGHTDIVRLLVQAGADPHLRDDLGLNTIDWAQRRGLTEVLDILTSIPRTNTPPRRITINLEEPGQPVLPAAETRESVSDAEKSNRWIAGFKQRLDEQEMRRLNRNEPPPQPQPVLPEPERVIPEPEPPKPEVTPVHSSRILLTSPAPTESMKRKRCPQCNEIYNSELVSYCPRHMIPLVDLEEPKISELLPPPAKSNPPLFWVMVIVTLIGSILLGSLITAYIYKTNQATARTPAQPPKLVQKGFPEVSGDLAGKATSLPEAECPLRGFEAIAGTVTVLVTVDKNGQVTKARGSGGDWLMRGAATEAAMKSTFAREKLDRRETEGTITYTFKP